MRIHLFLAAALLVGACNSDDGGGGGGSGTGTANPNSAAAKKAQDDKKKKDAADKAKKEKEKKMEVISFIPTLEKVVPPTEAATIRRRLKDKDFDPDASGNDNRDPWRSYTLPQIVEPAAPTQPTGVRPTDLCPKNKLIATNYAIKDLQLLGIVTRGVQHFALFRDTTGVGHIVERGKCLGREKGLVTEIGDGFVSGVIQPEVLPNGQAPEPVKFTIPLYPNELNPDQIETDETNNNGDDSATPPAPPPTLTPSAPPAPPTMQPEPPPSAPSQPATGNSM